MHKSNLFGFVQPVIMGTEVGKWQKIEVQLNFTVTPHEDLYYIYLLGCSGREEVSPNLYVIIEQLIKNNTYSK